MYTSRIQSNIQGKNIIQPHIQWYTQAYTHINFEGKYGQKPKEHRTGSRTCAQGPNSIFLLLINYVRLTLLWFWSLFN